MLSNHDPKKPNRRTDAAQRRRFFEPRAVRQRRRRFGVIRHGFRDDRLAAATLIFEARRYIHRGAEIVEHVARRDCDTRTGVKSESFNTIGVALAPALRAALKLATSSWIARAARSASSGREKAAMTASPAVLTTKP